MDHTHIRPYFLALLTTLLVILTIYLFRPFLITLGLAAVFAVILDPLNRKLMRDWKFSRGGAAITTLLIGLIGIAIPLSLVGVQLFREAQGVYVSVSEPGSIARAQDALSSLGPSLERIAPGASAHLDSLSANLNTYSRQALGWGLSHAGDAFSGTLRFVLQFFVFLMTLYYFLKEGPALRRSIVRLSPLTKDETTTLLARLTRTINSVVKGSLVIALIQGALTALGFFIFGVPNAVLWGTIAVVAALIPSLGTGLVWIPGAVYLLLTGSTGAGIGLAVYGFFIIGLIDNFLRPQLVGSRASIHPLLILLSVLGGLAFFGPAGIFLGPLTISLLLGLLLIYAPASKDAEEE